MRIVPASLVLVGALLAGPSSAIAGDTPAPPTATAEKPAEPKPIAIVKVDIAETIDGQATKENLSSYFVRKKLREAGYMAWSTRPVREDPAKKPADTGKKGDPGAPPAPPAQPTQPRDEKPEPDLIIKGYVVLEQSRTSVFYGKSVAFSFESKVKLEILDKAGQVLAKIEDGDEWGATAQETARNQELKRIALFVSADVLKSEPIRSRLTDKGKAQVDAYCADLEGKRKVVKHGDDVSTRGEGGEDGK